MTADAAARAGGMVLRVGDRVLISDLCSPTGTGTITRSDEWTAAVRLDSDGLRYVYANCELTLLFRET